MRADDGARLMTLVSSTECANPPTLVGGSLVISNPTIPLTTGFVRTAHTTSARSVCHAHADLWNIKKTLTEKHGILTHSPMPFLPAFISSMYSHPPLSSTWTHKRGLIPFQGGQTRSQIRVTQFDSQLFTHFSVVQPARFLQIRQHPGAHNLLRLGA